MDMDVMFFYIHIKHKVVFEDIDVNEHERETIKHYTQIQIKVKEQLVVRKGMDVNKHERLSNITLRYKLK